MSGIRKSKNVCTLFLLLLAGIVLGGFIGSLTENVSYLRWLNYGQTFGLISPITLDFGILVITFGITLKITLAGILGVMTAILVYRVI